MLWLRYFRAWFSPEGRAKRRLRRDIRRIEYAWARGVGRSLLASRRYAGFVADRERPWQ